MNARLQSVTPPLKLTRHEKKLIQESWTKACQSVGFEEEEYVEELYHKKIRAMQNAQAAWLIEFAIQMDNLFDVFLACRRGKLELPPSAFRGVTAALFYYINPFDVIPDTTPGRGHLDDAYVLELCVRDLAKSSPNLVAYHHAT